MFRVARKCHPATTLELGNIPTRIATKTIPGSTLMIQPVTTPIDAIPAEYGIEECIVRTITQVPVSWLLRLHSRVIPVTTDATLTGYAVAASAG